MGGSSPEEIAEQANALFKSDDDGVFFRMVHSTLDAIDKDFSGPTTLSFSLLNKYSWDGHSIQLFHDGAAPAIMAKPHAHELVKCFYPCDGDSMNRHYSCHVTGCPCDASG